MTPEASSTPNGQIEFTGNGSEYFRIWIVNLALTILTLGIYSAWAKVRRLQYFYRNTALMGHGFDYHGDPVAILKGRITGIVLLVAYNGAFAVSMRLGLFPGKSTGVARATSSAWAVAVSKSSIARSGTLSSRT
mgnify:CR=1 FL=1